MISTSDNWQKEFVVLIKETTDCTHEQAMEIMGQVCELLQQEYMNGYSRGYNIAKMKKINYEDVTKAEDTLHKLQCEYLIQQGWFKDDEGMWEKGSRGLEGLYYTRDQAFDCERK